MYDNVDFNLKDYNTSTNFLSDTPRYFDVAGEHLFSNGEMCITGNLDNLKVAVTKNRVTIGKESLCKWFNGDNFQTLSRGDTKRAIEKLSDILHLPIIKADVTRIDVSTNFIMKHPTDIYFNHLGELNRYQRLPQPTGIYYKTQAKTLLFYDKLKEQRAKGKPIPEMYQGRNVLRYEMRYTKRLPNEFKEPEITAGTLTDERFYIGLIDRYNEMYNAINKINDITINFEQMRGKKDLQTLGILALIEQQGGATALISQINEAYKIGQISKKQAFDIRQAIKEAQTATIGTTKNEAIEELNRKIKTTTKFYN